MKRWLTGALAFVASLAVVAAAYAQLNNIPPPDPNCQPYNGVTPSGQQSPTVIEPSYSIWCYSQPAPVALTRRSGANDWVDEWDNDGQAIQRLADHDMGYRRFDIDSEGRIKVGQFINVNHWMPDIADTSEFRLSGGSMLSPDRQFAFENGRFVVEADMAAGSDGMGGADAFYELDITSANAPTGISVDPLYGYGVFGGVGALGCRFERAQDGGHIVCAMYDNSHRDAGGTDVTGGPSGRPGRVWETQGVGTANTAASVQGGYPGWAIPNTNLHVSDVWRQCQDNMLDLYCRDRMRIEFTKTSIHVLVNGYVVMLIDGLYASNPATGADNRIPDSWLGGTSYYMTSWINGGIHHPTRWHWDRVAVNPHNADGSAAAPSAHPNFCLSGQYHTCAPAPPFPGGSVSTPAPTNTSVPPPPPTSTATPTRTATAQPTSTPKPASTATATPTGTVTHTCEVAAYLDGQLVRYRRPLSFCTNQ